MKDVLGGKGAAWRMTNARLPVPPDSTIQTEAVAEYMRGSVSPKIDIELLAGSRGARKSCRGRSWAQAQIRLLVSVRSGAKFSMRHDGTPFSNRPQDKGVESLAKLSNNPRFAYDIPTVGADPSVRRRGSRHPKKKFEHIFDGVKAAEKGEVSDL